MVEVESLTAARQPKAEGTMTTRGRKQSNGGNPKEREMEPGKTYVTILPGQKRPAFVRKRRDPFDTPSGISQSSVIIRPRAQSVGRPHQVRVRSEPTVKYIMGPPAPLTMLPPQWVTSSQPPQLAPPPQAAPQTQYIAAHEHPHPSLYTQNASMACPTANPSSTQAVEHYPQTSDTVTTEAVVPNIKDEVIQKHRCSACGKFRSPSYHARHPLAPGEVPRPSFCRKCIKERTSSEGSDTEEIQRQKRNHRRRNEKERKLYRKHRVKSSHTSKHSSSSLDDPHNIRSARSSSRIPAHRCRSYSSSFGDAGDRKSLSRDKKFDNLEHTIFVEIPPHRTPSRFRMQDSRGDKSYGRRLERHNSEYDIQNHTEREARIRPGRTSIDDDYNHAHNREYSKGSMLQGFSSSSYVQRGTHEGEREEDLDKQTLPYTASRLPLSNHSSKKSYDYDPNYDEAPPLPPPTRSVRIVKVILDGVNLAKSKRRDDNGYEDRVPEIVSTRSALHYAQSRKPILIESAESRRARRQTLVGHSTIVEEQDGSNEYSPAEHETSHGPYEAVYSPPAAPWNSQRRYYSVAPQSSDPSGITSKLERTHITPTESYTSRHCAESVECPSGYHARSTPYVYPEAPRRDVRRESLQYVEVPEGSVYLEAVE